MRTTGSPAHSIGNLPSTPRTDRRRLNARHADAVAATVRPMLGYLGRLLRRLEATGHIPGQRLYDLAYRAHDAVHSLTVALHADACDRHSTEPDHDWQI
jgi:hypothetical protein